MDLIAVVAGCALVAALAAFLVTAVPGIAADLIDPAVEEAAVRRSIWRHPKVRRFLQRRLDPSSAGGLMLTVALAALLVVTVVLGGLLQLIDESDEVERLDTVVSRWGADHATAAEHLLVEDHVVEDLAGEERTHGLEHPLRCIGAFGAVELVGRDDAVHEGR